MRTSSRPNWQGRFLRDGRQAPERRKHFCTDSRVTTWHVFFVNQFSRLAALLYTLTCSPRCPPPFLQHRAHNPNIRNAVAATTATGATTAATVGTSSTRKNNQTKKKNRMRNSINCTAATGPNTAAMATAAMKTLTNNYPVTPQKKKHQEQQQT